MWVEEGEPGRRPQWEPPMALAARTDRSLKLVSRLFAASLLLALLQAALGADISVTLICVVTGIVCLLPVYVYTPSRTVGVLFMMIWYVFSFGELLTKTILFQPVDSFLFSPLLTHLIMLVGAVAMSLGALAAYVITPFRGNALPPQLDPRKLTALAFVFAGFWLTSFALGFLGANGKALAIFFGGYHIAAFACATSAAIIRSKGAKSVSALSLGFGMFICVASLAANSKAGLMAVGFAYFMCVLAFGARLRWRTMTVVGLALFLLSVSVYPAIHLVRGHRERQTALQTVEETLQTSVALLVRDPTAVDEVEAMDRQVDMLSYNSYRNFYLGRSNIWFDRFIATGYIDAITRRVSFDGPFLGMQFVLAQSFDWLPRQFLPDKENATRLSSGDRIMRAFGMSQAETSSQPTVPMPIETFVSGGFFGIMLEIPVFAIFCLVLNIIVYDLKKNIWGVYLIIAYSYLTAVASYSLYLFIIARQLPADALLITIASVAANSFVGSTSGWSMRAPPAPARPLGPLQPDAGPAE